MTSIETISEASLDTAELRSCFRGALLPQARRATTTPAASGTARSTAIRR